MTSPSSSNLLDGEWTAEAIEAVLAGAPRVTLLPPLGSPEWVRAAANPNVQRLLGPLRAQAEKEFAEPLPELTDDLYAGFHRNGERLSFENVYFERRRRLARVAISLLLSLNDDPWRQRFLDSLVRKMTAVFEEVSWALPGHIRDISGKDPANIDLFCAETANLMAELLDLFGAVLPEDLPRRVRERLQHGVFEIYHSHQDWLGWAGADHNWNAVCSQGVLGAALSQVDDPRYLAEMLVLARRGLPFYLGGFGGDGGTSEGPVYWDYGFGWFAVLNEQLEKRTGGRLSLVEGNNKILEIANFGPRMSLGGGKVVNFSDCAAETVLRPSTLSYLGERLDAPLCRRAAEDSYRQLLTSGLELDAQRNDLFFLARALLRCPDNVHGQSDGIPEDFYFPELAVVVAHGLDRWGNHWDFAAKAGHNHEHHNHNDCGSYLLNINGERMAVEIGAPEYVKDFFGPRRYEFLAARTLGHSLPVINGAEQRSGSEYDESGPRFTSGVLGCHLDDGRVEFSLDATKSYPDRAKCKKFTRTFVFEKMAGRLTVADRLELAEAESLETAVISIHPVEHLPDCAVIRTGGLALAVRPDADTIIAGVGKHSYHLHDGTPSFVHRIVMKPRVLEQKVCLSYILELIDG